MYFLSNPFVALPVFLEMDRTEMLFDEFIKFSRTFWDSSIMPKLSTLNDYLSRINELTLTKEYCDKLSFTELKELIRAEVPAEKLREFCNFPRELSNELAEKMVRG